VGAMTWFVRYRDHGVDHFENFATPEEATEAACQLIHRGVDVYSIGTGSPSDSIDKDQILRIYQTWLRGKRPFGLPPRDTDSN
jgi:hypothetical protein